MLIRHRVLPLGTFPYDEHQLPFDCLSRYSRLLRAALCCISAHEAADAFCEG